MRRESIATSDSRPRGAIGTVTTKWGILAFLALVMLAFLAAAAASGQTEGTSSRYQDPNDPKRSGPGQAAPWSVEGQPPDPPPRPRVRDPDRDPLDEFWRDKDKEPSGGIRCKIIEVKELGRLYVEDVSGIAGGFPYWLQLPKEVKLVAENSAEFDGRKRLELEDLEAGQLLRVTLRKSDGEIVKVKVRAART